MSFLPLDGYQVPDKYLIFPSGKTVGEVKVIAGIIKDKNEIKLAQANVIAAKNNGVTNQMDWSGVLKVLREYWNSYFLVMSFCVNNRTWVDVYIRYKNEKTATELSKCEHKLMYVDGKFFLKNGENTKALSENEFVIYTDKNSESILQQQWAKNDQTRFISMLNRFWVNQDYDFYPMDKYRNSDGSYEHFQRSFRVNENWIGFVGLERTTEFQCFRVSVEQCPLLRHLEGEDLHHFKRHEWEQLLTSAQGYKHIVLILHDTIRSEGYHYFVCSDGDDEFINDVVISEKIFTYDDIKWGDSHQYQNGAVDDRTLRYKKELERALDLIEHTLGPDSKVVTRHLNLDVDYFTTKLLVQERERFESWKDRIQGILKTEPEKASRQSDLLKKIRNRANKTQPSQVLRECKQSISIIDIHERLYDVGVLFEPDKEPINNWDLDY